MSKTRRPILAALLALVFGPLGFFYFGWRHGVAFLLTALMAVGVFFLAVSIVPDIPAWVHLAVNAVLAWIAYDLALRVNSAALLPVGDERRSVVSGGPLLLAAVLTIATYGVLTTAALGVLQMMAGHVGRGVLILVVGTPIIGVIASSLSSLIFGLLPVPMLLGSWASKDLPQPEDGSSA